MKKGFTMIELLVALAITGIVGVFLAGFLTPQIQNFTLITEQGLAQSQCAGVFNVLREQIEYATKISVNDKEGTVTYTPVVENGAAEKPQTLNLVGLANEQFPTVERDGKQFEVTVTQQGKSVFEVSVAVKDGETAVYRLTQAVRCLNQ